MLLVKSTTPPRSPLFSIFSFFPVKSMRILDRRVVREHRQGGAKACHAWRRKTGDATHRGGQRLVAGAWRRRKTGGACLEEVDDRQRCAQSRSMTGDPALRAGRRPAACAWRMRRQTRGAAPVWRRTESWGRANVEED
jgi:hypothetical protein